jgi:purine-binding chemotaxis protein CheW
MPRADAARLHDNQVVLGCFEVKGGVYALDVTHLREVVRWQPVTPLPRAPALIEGVVDLRGKVIPVIDLGRALHAEPTTPGSRTRIAVVEVDALVVGLVVDAAIDVMSVDVSSLDDPPALATQAGYDATRAVVRRPGAGPILVLSLEHVLECVYRSALDRGEDAA